MAVLSNGVINAHNYDQSDKCEEEQKEEEFPSIIQVKNAIPKHCFQSSLLTSLYYVLKDFVIITSLYCSILLCDSINVLPLTLVWSPVYWFLQGTMFWAVFVLGHDCGHGSFSRYSLLNDVIGTVLHGVILVPYYPWKLSHSHHHKNTGNIDKEEIFYPVREKDIERDMKVRAYFGLGFGWFAYLLSGYKPRQVPHFNPFNPMFRKNIVGCVISIASFGLVLCAAFYYSYCKGIYAAVSHYFIPVIVFASWLVVVTFLHHNNVYIPWYADYNWGYVKGQISSVDRDYGWAHNLTHNIGTHQVHHLFIKIPHYHLEEAAFHFRKAFPQHVHICSKPILPAFSEMFYIFKAQKYISNEAAIHVYKDKSD